MTGSKRPSFTPEQIEWLCNRLDEFDPSDQYHAASSHMATYYGALDRAKCLIRGEIESWLDQSTKGSTEAGDERG